jgi:hypothetical protein
MVARLLYSTLSFEKLSMCIKIDEIQLKQCLEDIYRNNYVLEKRNGSSQSSKFLIQESREKKTLKQLKRRK